MVINSQVRLTSLSPLDSYHAYSTVSNSGFMRCLAGEQIWLRSGGSSVYATSDARYNTFSVYMMVDESG